MTKAKTGNGCACFVGLAIAFALMLTACGGGGNDEVTATIMPSTEAEQQQDGTAQTAGSALSIQCHFCAVEVIENRWRRDGQVLDVALRVDIVPPARNFEVMEDWGTYGIYPEIDHPTRVRVRGQAPPSGVPRENLVFSETLAWNGRLVGLTPQGEPVTGSAHFAIKPEEHYVHSLEFRNLESWAADMLPGETGTGTQWGDGDLHYYIRMVGVGFRDYRAREGFNKVLSDTEIVELLELEIEAISTAESLDDGTPEGAAESAAFLMDFYENNIVATNSYFPTLEREMDDGTISGALFADSFMGMGGVLYRDDLTAAFGGKR